VKTSIVMLCLVLGVVFTAAPASTPSVSDVTAASAFSSLRMPAGDVLSPVSQAARKTDNPGDTLYVDLEAFNNAVGLTAGGIFFTAARLTPTVACTVATVIFYKWDASNDDYLFVWEAGTPTNPGAIIESVPYSGSTTMAWQSIDLPMAVPLDANEDIWVGPRMNHSAGTYPLGVDDGPAVAGRGGWINYQGTWEELVGVGLDMNWHIRAILGHGGALTTDVGVEAILAPSAIVTPGSIQPKAKIRNFGTDPQSNIPVTCWIDSGSTRKYEADTVYPGPLASGATAEVPFAPNWNATNGTYKVTMFTSLGGDQRIANDTAKGTTQVMSYTVDWTQPTQIPVEGVSRVAACTDPDGKVHVICGNCQTHTSHPNDEIYDPAGNSWTTGLAHPAGAGVGVHNHDAVAIGDVIWCGGGSSGSGFYNNLTKLDLGGGTWTSVGAMPVSDLLYYSMEEYADSGWVYVIGGSPDGTGGPLDSCWRYNALSGTWSRMANMPGARRNMQVARIDDTIYVIGGMSANDYTSTRGTVWKYSVLRNAWTTQRESLPSTQGWGRAVASGYGRCIYTFGGYRAGTVVDSCWRFDLLDRTWYVDENLDVAARSHGADIDGRLVWVAGGYGTANLASVLFGYVHMSGVEGGQVPRPGLSPKAFPSVFRDVVRISYRLDRAGRVSLGVYDASGSLVRTLVNGTFAPGIHTAVWNRTAESGRRVSGGTYFYRLTVNGETVSGKAVVVH